MLAAYDAYGGRDGEVAGRVAAALELLHTALLIHDDVIDGDLVRRGSAERVRHVRGAGRCPWRDRATDAARSG